MLHHVLTANMFIERPYKIFYGEIFSIFCFSPYIIFNALTKSCNIPLSICHHIISVTSYVSSKFAILQQYIVVVESIHKVLAHKR